MATPDLAVTLWRAYPDTAVFDWLITLQEKQAMVGCTLTYGLLYMTNQTWLVENFLPQHRSFNIHPLVQNSTYWFTMLCTDTKGCVHTSRTIHFTTGLSNVSLPRVGARYSQRRIESRAQEAGVTDLRWKFLLTGREKSKISPHALLGVGCGLVGLLLTMVTTALVLRKYHKYKTEMAGISLQIDPAEMAQLKRGLRQKAEEVAEERRVCHQRLDERRSRMDSMDNSSTRIDSDSLLGSIDSNLHLPTLSLHSHCQQLMRERGGEEGEGGEGGGDGGGEGGGEGGGGEEEFATISLSSTERLI